MGCIIANEISGGCKVASGVYEIYLTSFPSTAVYYGSSDTVGRENEIGNISTDPDFLDAELAVEFFKFVPNKTSAELLNNFLTSTENGSLSHEQKISMKFNGLSQDKTDVLNTLVKTSALAFARGKSGDLFLVGKIGGADITGGSAGLGKAGTDLNGYEIELTAYEGEIVSQIDETYLRFDPTSIIAPTVGAYYVSKIARV